jgi:transposase
MLSGMSKHATIVLTPEQRTHLQGLIHAGAAPARMQTRARILLLLDTSQGPAQTGAVIAAALLCHRNTVGNVGRRYARQGLEAALQERSRPGAKPKLTGDIEAKLITLACSDPPEGAARWTLRLLADRLVELGHIESISHVSVGERLKKTRSNPGGSRAGAWAGPAPGS